jgi:ribose-phosphate pyrophosphokinase
MSITFKGMGGMSVPITCQKLYSDNTPMVKTDQWASIVGMTDTMVLHADSLAEFVNGMFLVDSVNMSGGWVKNLVLPYLPGARQDRVNPTGDVLFSAKSVADMINARQFGSVISVDPHSEVMPGLIHNFRAYPLERVYEKLPLGYDGVIAPDHGAVARASKAANTLGVPVTYAGKFRDPSTGALTGFEVSVDEGRHYVVIDDICDGGGTFIGLGELIREQGATADLYVTHGLFSKGTNALKKIYKNIITTDTRRINERNDVLQISVVSDMENYNV